MFGKGFSMEVMICNNLVKRQLQLKKKIKKESNITDKEALFSISGKRGACYYCEWEKLGSAGSAKTNANAL